MRMAVSVRKCLFVAVLAVLAFLSLPAHSENTALVQTSSAVDGSDKRRVLQENKPPIGSATAGGLVAEGNSTSVRKTDFVLADDDNNEDVSDENTDKDKAATAIGQDTEDKKADFGVLNSWTDADLAYDDNNNEDVSVRGNEANKTADRGDDAVDKKTDLGFLGDTVDYQEYEDHDHWEHLGDVNDKDENAAEDKAKDGNLGAANADVDNANNNGNKADENTNTVLKKAGVLENLDALSDVDLAYNYDYDDEGKDNDKAATVTQKSDVRVSDTPSDRDLTDDDGYNRYKTFMDDQYNEYKNQHMTTKTGDDDLFNNWEWDLNDADDEDNDNYQEMAHTESDRPSNLTLALSDGTVTDSSDSEVDKEGIDKQEDEPIDEEPAVKDYEVRPEDQSSKPEGNNQEEGKEDNGDTDEHVEDQDQADLDANAEKKNKLGTLLDLDDEDYGYVDESALDKNVNGSEASNYDNYNYEDPRFYSTIDGDNTGRDVVNQRPYYTTPDLWEALGQDVDPDADGQRKIEGDFEDYDYDENQGDGFPSTASKPHEILRPGVWRSRSSESHEDGNSASVDDDTQDETKTQIGAPHFKEKEVIIEDLPVEKQLQAPKSTIILYTVLVIVLIAGIVIITIWKGPFKILRRRPCSNNPSLVAHGEEDKKRLMDHFFV